MIASKILISRADWIALSSKLSCILLLWNVLLLWLLWQLLLKQYLSWPIVCTPALLSSCTKLWCQIRTSNCASHMQRSNWDIHALKLGLNPRSHYVYAPLISRHNYQCTVYINTMKILHWIYIFQLSRFYRLSEDVKTCGDWFMYRAILTMPWSTLLSKCKNIIF